MGHEHVYGICENKCMVEVSPKTVVDEIASDVSHLKQFTYVVNSDASLTYWLTNKASGTSSGGDDFTSVLIRKGTWNFTGNTVALDTIGTLYVEGEAGSKLVFTNTEKALWYSSLDNTADRSMYGVSVIGTSTDTVTYSGKCYPFHSCSNLTKCIGTATGINASNGFHTCHYLMDCTGTGTSEESNGSGYYNCSYLTNCKGVGSGLLEELPTGVASNGIGFNTCNHLVNCSGIGYSAKSFAYGFELCSTLTNCKGIGTTDAQGQFRGYGFSACHNVIGCKAGGHCTTNVFNGSYASHSSTATYAVADTANGGFNDTTNPAAT